jgi:ubiquinone/menaquinone biosynthesis C-methylase UbiE
MHHRFDDADKWAQMFDAPDRDAWQRPDEVVTVMEPMPGQTIADVGAGTGYFLSRLSRAVGPEGRVLGIDIEPSMVDHMRSRADREGLKNVEALVAKADDPGLAPASADRILIVNTWHHIASRGAYAAKLRAALAPGGAVFIVDFTEEAERGPPREHRLSAEAVIAELIEGGLAAEVVAEGLPDQYIVRGRLP